MTVAAVQAPTVAHTAWRRVFRHCLLVPLLVAGLLGTAVRLVVWRGALVADMATEQMYGRPFCRGGR